MWFLQMAQLSTTMSQDQRQTAFHFLTWNRGCFVVGESTSIGAFSAIASMSMLVGRYRDDDGKDER